MGNIYGGRKICPNCGGGKSERCPECNGWGHPENDEYNVCPTCKGGGYVSCRTCGGVGTIHEEKK